VYELESQESEFPPNRDPPRHTHLQQGAAGQLPDQGREAMALDRGTLAKIDRRIFAELGHDGGTQVVKVPLSDTVWSTWWRYCQAIGLTMGEAIAGLVNHELSTVVGEADGASASLYAGCAGERTAAREAELTERERDLAATEKRLHDWSERLHIREREFHVRVQRFEQEASRPRRPSTGRSVVTSVAPAARASSTSTATACQAGPGRRPCRSRPSWESFRPELGIGRQSMESVPCRSLPVGSDSQGRESA